MDPKHIRKLAPEFSRTKPFAKKLEPLGNLHCVRHFKEVEGGKIGI